MWWCWCWCLSHGPFLVAPSFLDRLRDVLRKLKAGVGSVMCSRKSQSRSSQRDVLVGKLL